MIELPEAVTISQQMTLALVGKSVAECVRGNAPMKFVFYNREPEEYAEIFRGRRIGASREQGVFILTSIEPGYTLALGDGGERIFLHSSARSLPKKHQFLLRFTDETYLTVNVQMWGMLQVWENERMPEQCYFQKGGLSPLDRDFTLDYWESRFADLPEGDNRAIKFFMISQPGVCGVGNGCLQDILWQAGIHHRRKAASLSAAERERLYYATVDTLADMTRLGGRSSELDLYGCPGRYQRILDSKTVGQPCPRCGAQIRKENFLGGTSYFCPGCQR